MKYGRQRHLLLDDSLINGARTWLKVRNIPKTTLGLFQVEAAIKEFRAQLECGYWTDKWDIYEIRDGLIRAQTAHDYLYSFLNKDYSHYHEDGSTRDDDEPRPYTYTSFEQVRL